MLSSPVTISNRIPPTSSSSESRSSAWAGERTGGQREQLRRHRPQLRQHHRDEHQPEPDVQALGEPVEPRRRGRPVEPGQVQEPDVIRDRLPELRAVGDVAEQAGEDHHGQGGQEDGAEHRGEPRPAQRAAEARQGRPVSLQCPDDRVPRRPPRRRGGPVLGLGPCHGSSPAFATDGRSGRRPAGGLRAYRSVTSPAPAACGTASRGYAGPVAGPGARGGRRRDRARRRRPVPRRGRLPASTSPATGGGALRAAAAARPDAVVLDLMLPGMQWAGACAARCARSRTRCRS